MIIIVTNYADSGLSTAAVGVIIIAAVLLSLVVIAIVVIALVITNKQKTYKIAASSSRDRNNNTYTGVPSSPHSASDDSGSVAPTDGTTNPTFALSQVEEADSKLTIDFEVAEEEKVA